MAREVVSKPSSLVWKTWNEDPTKMAVLRAIVHCQARLGGGELFGHVIVYALVQKWVCALHSYSLDPDLHRSPCQLRRLLTFISTLLITIDTFVLYYGTSTSTGGPANDFFRSTAAVLADCKSRGDCTT